MRQTWHIFLKDARRLRYEITVVLALTAAYAWSQGHWRPFPSTQTIRLMEAANMLRTYLLPMAWWFLASLAVYGEPLSGNRQFWITRPYRWTSLLGAKLLFTVTLISLPLLLADCFVLRLQGLRPWGNPIGLLWHESALFAVTVLPVIAVACVTANFGQAVLLALAVMVPLAILGRFFGPLASALGEFGTAGYSYVIGDRSNSQMGIWWPLACLVVASSAVVIMILQYRTRRIWAARAVFGATLLLILCGGRFLPESTTFALQSPIFKSHIDTSSVKAVFSPGAGPAPFVYPRARGAQQDEFAHLKLPIRFDGAPPGTTVVVEMMFAQVTPSNGKPWSTLIFFGQDPPDTLWHDAFVERSLIEQTNDTPVRIHLAIQLTVLGDPHTEVVPIAGGPHRVPGVGLCQTSAFGFASFLLTLNCRVPFRQPAYTLARFEGPGIQVHPEASHMRDLQWQTHYSPYPADFGINPISDSNWAVPPGATGVAFTTMQPLAHIHRELEIPSLRIAEFAR